MDVEEEVEAVLAVYLDDIQDPPVFDDARRCCFRVRIRSANGIFFEDKLSSEEWKITYHLGSNTIVYQ
jgi:hypothetical protein